VTVGKQLVEGFEANSFTSAFYDITKLKVPPRTTYVCDRVMFR